MLGTGQRGDGPEADPLRCALSRPHGVLVDAAACFTWGTAKRTAYGRLRLVGDVLSGRPDRTLRLSLTYASDLWDEVLEHTLDPNLTGKVAVVTGASKGIGLAITKAFVSEGVRVVAGRPGHQRETGNPCREWRGSGRWRSTCLTPHGPQTLVARAADYGGLDILVNNVGAVVTRDSAVS